MTTHCAFSSNSWAMPLSGAPMISESASFEAVRRLAEVSALHNAAAPRQAIPSPTSFIIVLSLLFAEARLIVLFVNLPANNLLCCNRHANYRSDDLAGNDQFN